MLNPSSHNACSNAANIIKNPFYCKQIVYNVLKMRFFLFLTGQFGGRVAEAGIFIDKKQINISYLLPYAIKDNITSNISIKCRL